MNTERISDKIKTEDIESWTTERPVIIVGGTGTGKSYFIMHDLYKYAKEHNQKILLLVHRKSIYDQFSADPIFNEPNSCITITTYQKLEPDRLSKRNKVPLGSADYVVCDEFHYFLSDAGMNAATDVSYNAIMNATGAVRIFMSATAVEMGTYIYRSLKKDEEPLIYKIKPNWDFINKIYVCSDDSIYEGFINGICRSEKRKGIMFMYKRERAYKLHEAYKEQTLFCCSSRQPEYKFVNKKKIKNMLKNERFNERILITTTCLDAGINLKDPNLQNIMLDLKDPDEIKQCIGRKRILSEDDHINLFLKEPSKHDIEQLIEAAKDQIEHAEYFLKNGQHRYLKKYPRQSDEGGILYYTENSNKQLVIGINQLRLKKRRLEIKEYEKMLKIGFSAYISKLFGDKERGDKEVTPVKFNRPLLDYLSNNSGKVLERKSDRQPLIKAANARDKHGNLLHNIEAINREIELCRIKYIVKEVPAEKKDSSGKRMRNKYSWIIVHTD